jgi:kynurenine--oxoglutarate transaminase/cysteine-S-conjugate beta-lyase/glutamine--phenylpyruvate transaminase
MMKFFNLGFKKYFHRLNNKMDNIGQICKTTGFDQLSIWYKFSRLALTTNSVNLGQGFPDWKPPQFFIDAIKKNLEQEGVSHQYSRTMGNLKLVDAIARNYQKYFEHKIDPTTEVLVTTGAVSFLYNAITALVEAGDEVILIEPFYDCYLPQVQFSGGKAIGIPMIPPKPRDRKDFVIEGDEATVDREYSKIKDTWQIDFDKLEASLNEKTRVLVLNTPNNPTGKILTPEELQRIAKILEKYPRVIVIMDEVYEFMIYNEYKELPRMANVPGMWDRTLSLMSAGKIFSATGCRVGWGIGPKHLISKVTAIFQFNSFCMYDPLQVAIAESLDIANQPYQGYDNYYIWLRNHYLKHRNYFMLNLAKHQGFGLNFFIPEGGYFLVAELKTVDVLESKYKLEGDESNQEGYLKDFNYLIDLAHHKGVVCIPCSAFYTKPNKHVGENYVRLAFCKQLTTLDKALAKF